MPGSSPVDGWRSQLEPDGSLRLSKQRTRGEIGVLLAFNLFWNGIVGMFTSIGLGWRFPGEYEGPTPGTPGFWLFLSPFLLIGACMLWALLHALLGSDEWRVRTNELVISWRTAGLGSSRCYTNAVLMLEHPSGERQKASYLYVEAAGKKSIIHHGADSARLGAVVAARAGWELQLPAGTMFTAPTGEPVPPRELPTIFCAGDLTVSRTPSALTVIDKPPPESVVGAAMVAVGFGVIIYMGERSGLLNLGTLLSFNGGMDWFSFWSSVMMGVPAAAMMFCVVRQLVSAVIRLRRGGDVFVFDRAAGQLTRNGRSLAALGDIRGIRLVAHTISDSDPHYQIRVETAAGRKIAVGDPQAGQEAMQAVAARAGEFLGVEVVHGNHSTHGGISIGS
jgi:hypothetical protein